MYLDFFKFKKSPFHITPDPDFLFLSPSHKEASASIFYGIETRKGFIAVTGEVGVGKTTILRSYLEGTDPKKIRIVYIFNTAVSFHRLLKQICTELGIESWGKGPSELVELLFHFLIAEYKKDCNVVLIIDEAQNIPIVTLERLRMLSNLETSLDKLIQIVLVGQPEFDARLELPELRQLKQRIAIRSRIKALSHEESLAYINHRLMRASLFHNPVFTKKALALIVKKAEGIPRTINILCDNALVTAFGYQRKPVDHMIVKEVIKDFRGGQPRSGFVWRRVWIPALAAGLLMAVYVARKVSTRIETTASSRQSFVAKVPKEPPAEKAVSASSLSSGKTKAAGVDPGPEASGAPMAKSAPAAASGKTVAPIAPLKAAPTAPEAVRAAGAPLGKKMRGGSEPGSGGSSGPAVKSGSAAVVAPPAGAQTALQKKAGSSSSPGNSLVVETIQNERPSFFLVVKKGDSVRKLLFDVYGKVNRDILASFRSLNPQVKDINKIEAGGKVFLPRVEPSAR